MDFTQYRTWRIDGSIKIVDSQHHDGTVVLVAKVGGAISTIAADDLEQLYHDRRAVAVEAPEKAEANLPPLEATDKRLIAARGLLWWCNHFDVSGCSRSRNAIARFIKSSTGTAERKGHSPVTATQLERAVCQRGVPGSRKLKDMIDGRSVAEHPTRMDEVVEEAITFAVAYYYDRRATKRRDAYVKLRSRLDEVGYQGAPPSEETLGLRIGAAATYENILRKFGALTAKARFKGVGKGPHADRPLECVVIDATPSDVLIVDDRTGAILGTAIVYVAVDVATRSVLAWYIGFGGETLASVFRLVMRILMPKTGLKALHGLLNDHAVFGLPTQIVLDNATAQVGRSFVDAMTAIGIDAEWAPVGSPTYKSVCERLHWTIKSKGLHSIGGAKPLPRQQMAALGIDPEVTAVATLGDADRVLASIIVDDYQRAPHDGIGEVAPAAAWDRLTKIHGQPYVADPSRVAEELGTYGEALLTRQGVRFRNLRFHDQNTTTDLLLDLVPKKRGGPGRKGKLSSGTAKVKMKWDPEDASRILVWNGIRKEYAILPNVDPRFSEGLSFESCEIIRRYVIAQGEEFESEADRIRGRARVLDLIDSLSPGLKGKRLTAARRITSAPDPLGRHVMEMVVDETNGSFIPVGLASAERLDDGTTEPGRRRGAQKASRTAKATRARKAAGQPTPEHAFDAVLKPTPTPVPLPLTTTPAPPALEVEWRQNTKSGAVSFSRYFEE
ncbi:DDE-type integrase/transposase/recombinase [Aureimonas flava]|nr:DDE-type integrase/transposase/recombinase [Aureimonas flava]